MWIKRPESEKKFLHLLTHLSGQVLIVQGARRVGKTSFILNTFDSLKDQPQLFINLLYPSNISKNNREFLGRDFFGNDPSGLECLKNIELILGPANKLSKPALIFIDEIDRYPQGFESVQTLAEYSKNLKFVFTGSNLENISLSNAATGRKCYFDLYPVLFHEFLEAGNDAKLLSYWKNFSLKEKISEYFHSQLHEKFETYVRLGGMPKILDTFLDPQNGVSIGQIVQDLSLSIEENIKSILGEKIKLYEYHDILRKVVLLSINTLKYTHLQVSHAGLNEAKKLISRTAGARVAHKIRLFEAEKDLSKYILFDTGIANYLLGGSDLLKNTLPSNYLAILYETIVGLQLIPQLSSRDDLFYWKSQNKAEVDFLLRSPLIGIDVKSDSGKAKSLNSFALFEKEAACVVKIGKEIPNLEMKHKASLPNFSETRTIPLLTIPHYFSGRLLELIQNI